MAFWRGAVAAGVVLGLGGFGAGRIEAQRLPGGVRPVHYSLTITPDLGKATFAGTETIEVVLDKPATSITLNAAEIEFGAVTAESREQGTGNREQPATGGTGAGGATATATATAKANAGILRSAQNDKDPKATTEILSFAQNDDRGGGADGGVTSHDRSASVGHPDVSGDAQAAAVTLDAAKEQATLTFARALPAGRVVLEIAYTGILNDKLRGFYLSRSKTRSYGVTQFEATDARRAFPCFDEPALKATFDVSLIVDAGDTALSNMKMVRDSPAPVAGKHTVEFATTPQMSTYLVAWVVGDFACTEGKQDGVPIRACATPDKVEMTRFALDAAKWDLHYYDKYFGIKYPMDKLDMVAVPDFEAGAMENFGCITFRETEMLVDEKNGALPALKAVSTTVAHEMAHQWFGDLVTPAWWDNLWLNEGFATWMESKAAAKREPRWNLDQDVAMELNHTMDEDASRTTRAIRTRAETPAEINELFDDIAYGKAGAVIGMVENWVGEEVFRRGVHAYLAAHLYGNATAEDFWDAQARVSGLPVDKVMRSFVDQPGVPAIYLGKAVPSGVPMMEWEFSISPEPQGVACGAIEFEGGSCVLPVLPSKEAAPFWTMPVCVTGDGCTILSRDKDMLPVSAAAFLYADADDKGYYRTAYTAEQWKAIVANAETGLHPGKHSSPGTPGLHPSEHSSPGTPGLTPPERIGLLGDAWALMRAGPVFTGQGSAGQSGAVEETVGEFLDLVLALKTDPNASVIDSALSRVDAIEAQIATDAEGERLQGVVRREFGPVYAALGGPAKHELYEHAQLRETLFEVLGEAKDPAVLAEAESLTRQLLAGQKPADPTLADAAVLLTSPSGDTEMYERMLRAARSAGDPDFKRAALDVLTRFQSRAMVERTLEFALSGEVRNQDSWVLIALLLERRETQDQAWEFVVEHWEEIERRATENSGARIVEAAGSFCTVAKRDAVAGFFRAHPVESSQRTLAKALDSIDDCIRLRAAQEPELRQWLDAQPRQ